MKKAAFISVLLLLFASLVAGCATTGSRRETDESLKSASQKPAQGEKVKLHQFIIGIGDNLTVEIYRHDDLKKDVKVGPSGKIMLPLIGDVSAADKGLFTLRDEIQDRYSKYLVDPQVFITVTNIKSSKVMVLGEVRSPGLFTLDSKIDVLEAIISAGGMTNDAKLQNVILIRKAGGKAMARSVNINNVLNGTDLSADVTLMNGDIVYVPAVTIASVSRYFDYLSRILSPVVNLGSGIVVWDRAVDVIGGQSNTTPLTIPTQ